MLNKRYGDAFGIGVYISHYLHLLDLLPMVVLIDAGVVYHEHLREVMCAGETFCTTGLKFQSALYQNHGLPEVITTFF